VHQRLGISELSISELQEAIAGGGLDCVLETGNGALALMRVHMELFSLRGAYDADALPEQPGGAIPHARIAVALGRLDCRRNGDEIAAAERRHDGIRGRIEREAQAAFNWLQGIARLRGGADVQVDGLHLLGNLLARKRAEGEDASDGACALDGAGERDRFVLRELAKLYLRRGARLHLRREAAEKQPCSSQRPERDARTPAGGCSGEQGFEKGCDCEPRGHEPATAGDKDAAGEGQGRKEERRAREAHRVVLEGSDVVFGEEIFGGMGSGRSLQG
jgi:hypothetical protein